MPEGKGDDPLGGGLLQIIGDPFGRLLGRSVLGFVLGFEEALSSLYEQQKRHPKVPFLLGCSNRGPEPIELIESRTPESFSSRVTVSSRVTGTNQALGNS